MYVQFSLSIYFFGECGMIRCFPPPSSPREVKNIFFLYIYIFTRYLSPPVSCLVFYTSQVKDILVAYMIRCTSRLLIWGHLQIVEPNEIQCVPLITISGHTVRQ